MVTLGIPNVGLELVLGSPFPINPKAIYCTVVLPSLMAHSLVVLNYL